MLREFGCVIHSCRVDSKSWAGCLGHGWVSVQGWHFQLVRNEALAWQASTGNNDVYAVAPSESYRKLESLNFRVPVGHIGTDEIDLSIEGCESLPKDSLTLH